MQDDSDKHSTPSPPAPVAPHPAPLPETSNQTAPSAFKASDTKKSWSEVARDKSSPDAEASERSAATFINDAPHTQVARASPPTAAVEIDAQPTSTETPPTSHRSDWSSDTQASVASANHAPKGVYAWHVYVTICTFPDSGELVSAT